MIEETCGPVARAVGNEFACVTFADLVVAVAKREGATLLIRGLRSAADFEYEMEMAGMNGGIALDETGGQPGGSLPMTATGTPGDIFGGAGLSHLPDLAGSPPGSAAMAGSPDGLHRLSSGLAGTIGLAALLGSRAGSVPQAGHPEGAAEDGFQQPLSAMPALPTMGGTQPPSSFDGLFGAMHGNPPAG